MLSVVLGLAAMACSCAARPAPSAATGGPGNSVAGVPDFAGTAAPLSLPSSCRNLLPPSMPHPFTPAGRTLSAKDYTDVECWTGTLAGKKFKFGTYFSPAVGAGLAIRYGGALVSHLQVGSGPPTVVRFTGNDVCVAERAGAYFEAADLRTGARMDEERAQDVCPPPAWPPTYVLGLRHKHYPVAWPGQAH